MREHHSKSALNSAKQTNNMMMGPSLAREIQNAGNSMKRRDKGRLIMQEWLSKSNNNGVPQQQIQGSENMQNQGNHQKLINQVLQNA